MYNENKSSIDLMQGSGKSIAVGQVVAARCWISLEVDQRSLYMRVINVFLFNVIRQ